MQTVLTQAKTVPHSENNCIFPHEAPVRIIVGSNFVHISSKTCLLVTVEWGLVGVAEKVTPKVLAVASIRHAWGTARDNLKLI